MVVIQTEQLLACASVSGATPAWINIYLTARRACDEQTNPARGRLLHFSPRWSESRSRWNPVARRAS